MIPHQWEDDDVYETAGVVPDIQCTVAARVSRQFLNRLRQIRWHSGYALRLGARSVLV
jgi:hypothetical protein